MWKHNYDDEGDHEKWNTSNGSANGGAQKKQEGTKVEAEGRRYHGVLLYKSELAIAVASAKKAIELAAENLTQQENKAQGSCVLKQRDLQGTGR